MPTVNLVPMMDVIMTVLTFFIIVSMSLSRLEAVDTVVPAADSGPSAEQLPDPLIIEMNLQQQFVVNKAVVTEAQAKQQAIIYLKQNPKGAVIFKPDENLPYEKVVQTIGNLQAVGGDRVSLGVE